MKLLMKIGLLIGILVYTHGVSAEVQTGELAPNFTLTDQDGTSVTLNDLLGKVVVLEWTNPDCPFVRRHHKAHTMEYLYDKYKGDNLAWLAINSTHWMKAEDDIAFRKEYGIPYPVLSDASGEVGRMYGASTTPHMFVIGEDGKVLYQGAIDDDPMGTENSPVNYVDLALAGATKGAKLTIAETRPYGCSVKYRSAG